MPRHRMSDEHEWIREIPTVLIYCLAKPPPREYINTWPAPQPQIRDSGSGTPRPPALAPSVTEAGV